MKQIAIIGAGPLGVEAALYGACAGYDVQLFERGDIAHNVREWGHVRVFTEWKRNRSPLACRLLAATGYEFSPDESTSTGHELADYVARLTQLEPLRGRLHLHTTVANITRESCLKSDFIDDPRRAAFPFRLLLRDSAGERLHHADAVLDATGVYATPNWAGSGGAPCPGEEANRACIDYHLPDVAGRDRDRFANRHTLVIGSGHSAASTLLAICGLMGEFPRTRATWIVRRDVPPHGLPYTLNPEDVTKHRQELQRLANEATQNPNVHFVPRTTVDSIEHDGACFRIMLRSVAVPPGANSHDDVSDQPPLNVASARLSTIECHNIAAHTGFRPDAALWSELQVPIHAATDGPATLAAVVVEQNKRAGVGLSTGYAERRPRHNEEDKEVSRQEDGAGWQAGEQCPPEPPPQKAQQVDPRVASPDLLRLPEPNFHVIGIKSYGRDAGFLMQNGFRQVRDAYRLLSDDPNLDLYGGTLD